MTGIYMTAGVVIGYVQVSRCVGCSRPHVLERLL